MNLERPAKCESVTVFMDIKTVSVTEMETRKNEYR